MQVGMCCTLSHPKFHFHLALVQTHVCYGLAQHDLALDLTQTYPLSSLAFPQPWILYKPGALQSSLTRLTSSSGTCQWLLQPNPANLHLILVLMLPAGTVAWHGLRPSPHVTPWVLQPCLDQPAPRLSYYIWCYNLVHPGLPPVPPLIGRCSIVYFRLLLDTILPYYLRLYNYEC